jgi:hypothetical protein
MARPSSGANVVPRSIVLVAGACLLGGCSGELTTSSLSAPFALTPLPVSSGDGRVATSATDLYTRVARGALNCWFGRSGALKQDYIYHADAHPPSRGGGADIGIHVRDLTAPSPRGVRAFRILITQDGSASTYAVENLRMPETLAARMTRDVERWAVEEAGCGEAAPLSGWGAEEAIAPTPAAPAGSPRSSAAARP